MKTLPYMIFSFLMLCALCTSINSYRRTENIIAQDVNRALEQVLVKMPDNMVTTDTIRCYRNCLTIGISYGGIVFYNDKFMTLSGEQIRLTPMQHSLLEMFITSDTHTLSKQHICDRLWPKKPDASDTLYTLIKRIKPIIETHSTLKIQSDRGKSYSLIIK